MEKPVRKSLVSALVAALLLGVVLMCRSRTAWADWYALHFYPAWSGAVSWLSARVPFSLDEWVVILAAVLALAHLVRLRKRWAALIALLLWITVWFYGGWGINYFRSSIFERAGKRPEVFEPQRFRLFLEDYAQQLNASYRPVEELDRAAVEQEVKQYYATLSPDWGLAKPKDWQRPKRLVVNRLYSAVGVTGYVGPFFSEIQVNEDTPDRQYPFLFAHELSHLLGVSSEAEANFWAWQACRASADPLVRYAGLQSLLPYVLSNARAALPEEEFVRWRDTLRPEVKTVLQDEQAFWRERYVPWIGRLQSKFYNLFLKGNRIRSGMANYNEVVQMILTLQDNP
jgi:hypothetical protein